MRFDYINEHAVEYGTYWMCDLLDVSASGYYAWRRRGCRFSLRQTQDTLLSKHLVALFKKHRRNYGSPRLRDQLCKQGIPVSRKRVARLMREAGLRAKSHRKRCRTTDSRHGFPIAPNIVDRQFRPKVVNTLWAGDITYIPTREGFSYLAAVLDLYSRRVVGFSFDTTMATSLCTSALRHGLRTRTLTKTCVHHSDQGSQYASEEYQKEISKAGMTASMSRKGNCWDNAVLESFFGTLKRELDANTRDLSHKEIEVVISEYIQYYNFERSHSTLGYRSPVEFELATSSTVGLV